MFLPTSSRPTNSTRMSAWRQAPARPRRRRGRRGAGRTPACRCRAAGGRRGERPRIALGERVVLGAGRGHEGAAAQVLHQALVHAPALALGHLPVVDQLARRPAGAEAGLDGLAGEDAGVGGRVGVERGGQRHAAAAADALGGLGEGEEGVGGVDHVVDRPARGPAADGRAQGRCGPARRAGTSAARWRTAAAGAPAARRGPAPRLRRRAGEVDGQVERQRRRRRRREPAAPSISRGPPACGERGRSTRAATRIGLSARISSADDLGPPTTLR